MSTGSKKGAMKRLAALTHDQYFLLQALVEFALEKYQDNASPRIEGYRRRLQDLQLVVEAAAEE
jgi:hypothetical protein